MSGLRSGELARAAGVSGLRSGELARAAGVSGLRSGELARAAGVNQQTLRYYERRGLLPEPDRTLGGHRVYPAAAVTTVRAIKAVQRLGFTLGEVAELMDGARHRHRSGRRSVDAKTRKIDLGVPGREPDGGAPGREPDGGAPEADAVVREHVAAKLADVEAKIRDLGVVRDALRSALDAGCDNLEVCTQDPDCPLALDGPTTRTSIPPDGE